MVIFVLLFVVVVAPLPEWTRNKAFHTHKEVLPASRSEFAAIVLLKTTSKCAQFI